MELVDREFIFHILTLKSSLYIKDLGTLSGIYMANIVLLCEVTFNFAYGVYGIYGIYCM